MKYTSYFDTDAFVRYESIPNSHYRSLLADLGTPITSNVTSVPFAKFLRLLHSHETRLNPCTTPRIGVTLTFMLDHERSMSDLVRISEEVAHFFNDLPYFSFHTTIGNGHYIRFFFSERYFSPKRKKMHKIATSDRYQDSVTGRVCKKNHPNAVLISKKGDPLKATYFAYFTKKERTFTFANEREFLVVMEKFKTVFVRILEEHTDADISRDLTVHKFSIQKGKYCERSKRAVWNRHLVEMENLLNEALATLKMAYALTSHSYHALLSLRDQFCQCLRRREYRYKQRYSISINFRKPYIIAENDAECFVDQFRSALHTLLGQLILI